VKDQPEIVPEPLRADFLAARARREDWHGDIAPLLTALARSREMAFAFARMALVMLFILNAAVVAFPALAQLVGTKLPDHLPLALLSVAAFVIGLVCTAAATLLSFLALFADSLILTRHLETLARRGGPAAQSIAATELERGLKRDRRTRRRALRFGLLSFAAFLVGVVFAALILSARVAGPASAIPI
jgi:MFS family permease